jgi:alpha-D-ribose 1-methylphosphonate 5-triphosphate synthase subunit PhnL
VIFCLLLKSLTGKGKYIMLYVEHISKTFTLHMLSQKRIHGFTDINFTVQSGQALVLSAPSGMGKSSILKCIYRTYIPSKGRIRYQSALMGEVDLATLDEHRLIRLRRSEISYVTQFLKVLPRVTTVDIVAEPLMIQGVSLKKARDTAGKYLTRLKIPSRLFDAFPITFSGGEQQRVNIARAVIGKPRLLLLDEPTASLDASATMVVLEMLRELKKQGTAIVAVFHDRGVAEQIADNFYLLTSKEIEPCPYNLASSSTSFRTHWLSKTPM